MQLFQDLPYITLPTTIVNVKELVGNICVGKEQGNKLHDVIYPLLRSGQIVRIDFTGVEACEITFYMFGFGRLLTDITLVQLTKLLKFTNLPPGEIKAIRGAMAMYKEYYLTEPLY